MAATAELKARPLPVSGWGQTTPVSARTTNMLRVGILLGIALVWESVSRSGLLFRDVVPSLLAIGASIGKLLANPVFYSNLYVTAWEVFSSLAIGSALGIFVGILLGANRFLAACYEP